MDRATFFPLANRKRTELIDGVSWDCAFLKNEDHAVAAGIAVLMKVSRLALTEYCDNREREGPSCLAGDGIYPGFPHSILAPQFQLPFRDGLTY